MLSIREQQRLLQRMHYSVSVNGEPSDQMTRCIKMFQRDFKRPPTGILTDDEETLLQRCGTHPQREVNTHA